MVISRHEPYEGNSLFLKMIDPLDDDIEPHTSLPPLCPSLKEGSSTEDSPKTKREMSRKYFLVSLLPSQADHSIWRLGANIFSVFLLIQDHLQANQSRDVGCLQILNLAYGVQMEGYRPAGALTNGA